MRLTHNLASLNIYNEQSKILKKQETALERVSTGSKVNRTRDNPNALAKSERLRMQIRGSQMASQNVQDGISMLQTADGALGSISEMLTRIRELTVQAGSDNNSESDKKIIENEINQTIGGIRDVANNTEFSNIKIFAETKTELEMPTGANVSESVKMKLHNLSGTNLIADANFSEPDGINKTLADVDIAINRVLSITSEYGALENRFESTYNNLGELSDKMTGAESSIRDADIAEEMMELAKSNILVEAGNAMMVQSNKFPQDILRILENIRR